MPALNASLLLTFLGSVIFNLLFNAHRPTGHRQIEEEKIYVLTYIKYIFTSTTFGLFNITISKGSVILLKDCPV